MSFPNASTFSILTTGNDVTSTYWSNVSDTNTSTLFVNSVIIVNQSVTNWNGSSLSNRAVYIYPGPVICVFGMICNILNLCVLYQPQLSDSPYSYLTALAFSDLGLLSISFFHLVNFGPARSYFNTVFDSYIFFGVGNICFNCSVWLIVLLTIERTLFVIRPLHTRSSVKRARISIAITVIFCSIINIPRFLCFTVTSKIGTNIHYPKGTEFRKSLLYYKISLCQAIIINVIPLIILLIGNSILVYAVHHARKKREAYQMNSNQEPIWRRDQAKLTKTLISIVILFILCTFPSAFADDPIAYNLFAGDIPWDEFLSSVTNETFIYISNLLLFINSSLNFVLYCVFNDKFRKAMMGFFVKVQQRSRTVRANTTSLMHRKHKSYSRNRKLRATV